MRRLSHPAHDLEHDGAANTVVPSLCEVAIVGQDCKVGDGRDGITGRNTESCNVSGVRRPGIEKEFLPLHMARRVMWRDVRVPNVGDGGDRPFGAENHPALVGERCIQPISEHLHGDKAVGTDVANHAAEFVHVGIEHDARARVSLLRDD